MTEEMLAVAYLLAATPHFTKTLRMLVRTHYRNVYCFTEHEWEQILFMVGVIRYPDEFQVGDHVKFEWEGEMIQGIIKKISGSSYLEVLPHGYEDWIENRYVILTEMCLFDD